MPDFLISHALELGSYVLIGAMWLLKGESNTKANTEAIERLETAIKDLVVELRDALRTINNNQVSAARMEERISSHDLRLSVLEKNNK